MLSIKNPRNAVLHANTELSADRLHYQTHSNQHNCKEGKKAYWMCSAYNIKTVEISSLNIDYV